jgi:uncharacterized membrane protein YcaP (DUF421 family)
VKKSKVRASSFSPVVDIFGAMMMMFLLMLLLMMSERLQHKAPTMKMIVNGLNESIHY